MTTTAANRLRLYRLRAKLTQSQLGNRASAVLGGSVRADKSLVSQYESGKILPGDMVMWEAFGTVLGLDSRELRRPPFREGEDPLAFNVAPSDTIEPAARVVLLIEDEGVVAMGEGEKWEPPTEGDYWLRTDADLGESYKAGDLLRVHASRDAVPGKPAIVRRGERIAIRKATSVEGKILLEPFDDARYAPDYLAGRWAVVGVVLAFYREV